MSTLVWSAIFGGAVFAAPFSCLTRSLTFKVPLCPLLSRLLIGPLLLGVVEAVPSFLLPRLWRCIRAALSFSSCDATTASPQLFLRVVLFSLGDLGRVSGSCNHMHKKNQDHLDMHKCTCDTTKTLQD